MPQDMFMIMALIVIIAMHLTVNNVSLAVIRCVKHAFLDTFYIMVNVQIAQVYPTAEYVLLLLFAPLAFLILY